MALNHLQEPRDIEITQCKHEVSHFYWHYFPQEAFTAIFEEFPYIVFNFNGQNRNAIVNRLMSRINRIQRLGRLWKNNGSNYELATMNQSPYEYMDGDFRKV